MIISMDIERGSVPLQPVAIFDRHGVKVDRKIIECDTDTGKIICISEPLKHFEGQLLTEEIFVDAPLNVRSASDSQKEVEYIDQGNQHLGKPNDKADEPTIVSARAG